VIVPAESICPASRLGRLVPAAVVVFHGYLRFLPAQTLCQLNGTTITSFQPLSSAVSVSFLQYSLLLQARLVLSHRLASLRFASHLYVRNPINDRPPYALARAAFFASSGLSPFHWYPADLPAWQPPAPPCGAIPDLPPPPRHWIPTYRYQSF
jgi:hypothetical protein